VFKCIIHIHTKKKGVCVPYELLKRGIATDAVVGLDSLGVEDGDNVLKVACAVSR